MKLLHTNLSRFDKNSHGYFRAKKYFQGKYNREVLLTIYDTALDRSSFGYLFLCDNNVLIHIMDELSDPSGIYELDSEDRFSLIDSNSDLLRDILNKTLGGNISLSTSTLNPKPLIYLNDKFLLVCNIQTNLNYGYFIQGAVKTIYLNSKHDSEKINNLIILVKSILKHETKNFSITLPGLSASISKINFYVGAVTAYPAVLGIVSVFIYILYIMVINLF